MRNIQGGNVWKFQTFLNQLVIMLLKIALGSTRSTTWCKGALHGIDVEVDTENIESYHRLKGKESNGRVILKLSMRKDAAKIKLNKKKLKNIDHKELGLSSGTKVFINESLCGYYKLLWSKCKKLFLEKRIALFWVTNGTVKKKLLNDQVRSITHELDLSSLIHESPLVSTDRNKLINYFV